MPRALENLSKRKPTGGRRVPLRSRRARERDSFPSDPTVGKERSFKRRSAGGSHKLALRKAGYANVTNLQTKKTVRAKILKLLQNPANRDYARRGVITKGARIETEVGSALVTSRLGQHGLVNAVLLK